MRSMPGITLSVAQARLQQYLDAEAAVLLGQRYEIAGRMLQRADLEMIQEGVKVWNQRVEELERKASGRSRMIVPRPGF